MSTSTIWKASVRVYGEVMALAFRQWFYDTLRTLRSKAILGFALPSVVYKLTEQYVIPTLHHVLLFVVSRTHAYYSVSNYKMVQ